MQGDYGPGMRKTPLMDAVDRLTELISPPSAPVRGRGDWAEFAIRNGFEAPADYRRLIETYGAGEFGTFLVRLLEPFHPEQSLVEASEWDRQNVEGSRRLFPDQSPEWPIWPEQGGFLPWASTADGDLVGWGTAGNPDAWNTLCWGDQWEVYEMGIGDFLVAGCEGRIGWFGEEGIPLQFDPYPEAVPAVEPFRTQATVRLGVSPPTRFFEAAIAGLAEQGIRVLSYGDDLDDRQACELTIDFRADLEPVAKAAVISVAQTLGAPILDVHDLRQKRIWVGL